MPKKRNSKHPRFINEGGHELDLMPSEWQNRLREGILTRNSDDPDLKERLCKNQWLALLSPGIRTHVKGGRLILDGPDRIDRKVARALRSVYAPEGSHTKHFLGTDAGEYARYLKEHHCQGCGYEYTREQTDLTVCPVCQEPRFVGVVDPLAKERERRIREGQPVWGTSKNEGGIEIHADGPVFYR
jgi:hypothetical protein